MNYRDDTTDLFTPIYDEAMLETYDMLKKVCEKLFYIQDDDSKQVDTTGVSGLGQWTATPEGTAITQEDIVQMYNESFVHTKYANAFKVTDEAMEDDEYALISKVETAEEMGKGAVVQQERMCADIFNLHTTTAGADEVALVDAAHPKNPNESGTTYDNELTGASSALSHESIEDMDILIAGNLKDPKGILVPRPVRGCLLVRRLSSGPPEGSFPNGHGRDPGLRSVRSTSTLAHTKWKSGGISMPRQPPGGSSIRS